MSIASVQRRHGSRVAATSLLLVVVLAGPAAAQHATPARACSRPDTSAAWYRTQRAWWARDAKHDWSDDTLRNAFVSAARALETSPMRDPFPLQLGVMVIAADRPAAPVDPEVARLRGEISALGAKKTWPTRSMVGVAGEHAAWLIAAGDSALMVGYTHQLMEAGAEESPPFDVAVVEDWIRVLHGRKPIYASQLHAVTDAKGGRRLEPIASEDLAHVDLRRENAALPPLAFALCVANANRVKSSGP